MAPKFIYEVGVEKVYGHERITDGAEMFCAHRLSDDKFESRVGQAVYGSTPQELAKNIKLKIQEEAQGDEFSWESQEIRVSPEDRLLKRMNHEQYNVHFLGAMSFAPQSVS